MSVLVLVCGLLALARRNEFPRSLHSRACRIFSRAPSLHRRFDAAERSARVDASYPAIRAFSAVAFAQVNFSVRVEEERELVRYADIIQETLSRQEYLEARTFSEAEVEAILRVVTQVRMLTGELYGRTVQPLMCLFPPIAILRAVEAIAGARGRRLKIFEIGPGSGYLGAYLINAGHSYASMDIT
jgi:hypothetical protein